MSASDPTSAIFMSDSKKDVQKKINKFAFSGGRATMEEHRQFGGNPDVDVPFQYLTYFLDDDAEIERLRTAYKSGEMLTGEMKQYCIKVMQDYVEDFQTKRKQVTPQILKEYMTPRRLQWGGNPNPVKPAAPIQAQSGKKSSKSKTSSTPATPAAQSESQSEAASQPASLPSGGNLPAVIAASTNAPVTSETTMAELVQRLDLDSVGSLAAQPVLPVLASAQPNHSLAAAQDGGTK